MVSRYLWHGSAKRIRSRFLLAYRPGDRSSEDNSLLGVYATDRKDIALGMALAGSPHTRSFGDYERRPFQIVFVRGSPRLRYVYVYNVASRGFVERPPGSHQWVAANAVRILSREKHSVASLSRYWRRGTRVERKWFWSNLQNE